MCGIAGIVAYGSAPPINRAELRTIRDHMALRGPDGEGEWFSPDGRVGLAHRRLAIIDLDARAAQPMSSADGQLVITFNGEIYNHRELRQELQARGCRFSTDSDTEVLLHLYAEKGEAMLGDLRGMFAFSLWDSRRQALFLARDAFGIKPLYYSDDGRTFRFASQVKALLAGGHVDTTPEPAGHAGFFLWGSVPDPWTLYRGIRSLEAGQSMWVAARGSEEPKQFSRVCDIFRHAANNPATGTTHDALEAISAAVADSVAAHQVADVPVAMFLSAGLDSAIINALATQAGQRPHSITLGFAEYAGTAGDEAPMAEKLAAMLGTRHATLMVRKEDFEEDRERLLKMMDQPSIDGVNTWFVAKAAASQGVKVALSGVGGDELFASYSSFLDLPRMQRLASPVAAFPRLGKGFRRLSLPVLSRFTSPKYAGLFEYGGSLGGAYILRRSLYMPWELVNVLDPELATRGWEDLKARAELNTLIDGFGSDRMAISALEMSAYMRNQLLRDADWAGMAHSLEIRVPFVDSVLLKRIAPWLAAHPHLSKRAIARAIAPQLPATLFNKPKTGFTIPVREWLASKDPAQSQRGLRGWASTVYREASP